MFIKISADDIITDDNQPGPSTLVPPGDQSDGVEVVTENNGGDSTSPQPVFAYPVTPDPNPDTDFTTVNPVPYDFNVRDLDVRLDYVANSTYDVRVVQGRAACSKFYHFYFYFYFSCIFTTFYYS